MNEQTEHQAIDAFHERRHDFELTFGNHGFFEDGFLKAMDRVFDLCAISFGHDVAQESFDAMIKHVLPGEDHSSGWQRCLEDAASGLYSELPIGELFHDLSAYADYGIVLTTARSPEQREQVLGRQITDVKRLLELLPVEQWQLKAEDMIDIGKRAVIRWKLDTGEPITARELALISGRAFQTIKNKLARTYGEIEGNVRNIPAKEALAWLARQPDFHMSIWRTQDDTEHFAEPDLRLEEVVFVPVARDGSVFHPGLHREGVYLVDAEGAEQKIADFDEALKILQSMYIPEWRRPGEGGRWTRVRGLSWRRMQREDLDFMARDFENRMNATQDGDAA